MQRREFLCSTLALAALGRDRGGQLLVVDAVGAALDFFDGRTFARLGRVALDHRPREIAVPPGGGVAYVAIYGPGVYGDNTPPGREIVAVELATRTIAKKIALGPHVAPHAMAIASDGRIWVTCETEGSLLLIDPAAKARSKTISAVVPLGVKGSHWVAIAPDGSKIYATSRDNPVLSVVDSRDRKLIREVKTPGGLDGLAIAPDGRRLFAASLSKASLWVVDTREDRVVREFPLTARASRLKTIDGGLIVAHEESGTIEVFDVPSMRRRGMAKVGRSPSGIAVSADGKMAYVASFAGGTVTLVDLASLRVVRTIECGGGPDGLALAQG